MKWKIGFGRKARKQVAKLPPKIKHQLRLEGTFDVDMQFRLGNAVNKCFHGSKKIVLIGFNHISNLFPLEMSSTPHATR